MIGENIIFIVGSGRCGSTWLQKILGAHDKIVTAQESHIFSSWIDPVFNNYMTQLNNPSGRGGTGLPCYFTKDEILSEMRELFYRMMRKADWSEEKYFVDKSPTHALFIDTILTILPKAKIIHLVRDPRDVAASMIAASKGWGKNWAPSNIFSASFMWKKYVSAVEKSFEKVRDNQKYVLRYEDLKSNTEYELEKLLNHIGISADYHQTVKLLEASNSFRLKKFGEFRMITGEFVNDPKEFDQKKHQNNRWKEDLGRVKGFMISIMLSKKMKRYGYR